MNSLNFQWKKNEAQYQTGESLYLGRVRVASYGWNTCRSRSESEKDDSKRWSGLVTLPQAREGIFGKDEAEVKSKIEFIVKSWFKEVWGGGVGEGIAMKKYHWSYQCLKCFIKSGYGFTGTESEAYDNVPTCCDGEPMHAIRGDKAKEKE